MQKIIIEKPYVFVPPHRGSWWPTVIQGLNLYGPWLRKTDGVASFELRHVERLRESLRAGHGIMLTPNHCRQSDPLVLGKLAAAARTHVFAMASWHLFNQGWFNAWAIRKMGGFSVNREGVDRQAINTAIQILEAAERPLVVFPEGAVSRTNDRLHALLDGVTFIARAAAKRRAKQAGQVVIHPIGIKYLFQGDIDRAADNVLTDIEQRLTWQPQRHLPLLERINKVGLALLGLKEMEYLGRVQAAAFRDRQRGLIDRLLHPIEREWFGEVRPGPTVPRVKDLRVKILPAMVHEQLAAAERDRRWRQLADLYLAQQVSCYLPDYLDHPSVDRLLETIERFEEDLTDTARVHGDLHAVIHVGEPIPVSAERERGKQTDPLMQELESRLQAILDELARESRVYQTAAGPPASAVLATPSQD